MIFATAPCSQGMTSTLSAVGVSRFMERIAPADMSVDAAEYTVLATRRPAPFGLVAVQEPIDNTR